jgi:hypothetical protein
LRTELIVSDHFDNLALQASGIPGFKEQPGLPMPDNFNISSCCGSNGGDSGFERKDQGEGKGFVE